MRRRVKDCGAAGTRVVGRSVEGWVVVVFEGCLHDCQFKIIKRYEVENKLDE